MHESIRIEQIRCERCVSKLAQNLAPVKGINEARIEMGTSSVIIDYDDEVRDNVDAALVAAGFRIIERREIATPA